MFPRVLRNRPVAAGRLLRCAVMTSLPSGAGGASIQVTRENVLQARAVLLQEVETLESAVASARVFYGGIGLCGQDPVSKDAAPAFSERTAKLFDEYDEHGRELRAMAAKLATAANAYGYTEEEISTSLSTYNARVIQGVQHWLGSR